MIWLYALAACTFVTDAEWAARTPECDTEGLYLDLDRDGYGNQAARDCEEAAAGIPQGGDCDDGDPEINPGATEVYYDGVDQNCDDANDDDADGDGFSSADHGGDDCMDAPTDPVPALAADCGEPTGLPTPESVHPGAEDTPYDGVDTDCSGGTDYDRDRDGWSTCNGDCDDTLATTSPGVAESWYDNLDQDCDGNDGDQDGDGYVKSGYTGGLPVDALPGDCDDDSAQIHPGAADPPYDGVDADCEGDDDYDADGDGIDGPSGEGPDCDDDDPEVSPSGTERCDTEADDDCDGATDALDALDCTTWYVDSDGDGLGGAESVCTCEPLGAYDALSDTDCDDGDAAITIPVWYGDADADGAGVPDAPVAACTQPAGYAPTDDDCDDAEATTFPGATEACDTVDSDCDGALNDPEALGDCVPWYEDIDADGYGSDTQDCLCAAEGTFTATVGGDCDDADATVSPGATEVCGDGTDGDCDGGPGDCPYAGSFTPADAAFTWTGTAAGDAAGSVLTAAGDLDADGLDELATTAPGYVGPSGLGLVAVLRPGLDTSPDLDAGAAAIANPDADLSFAAGLTFPGDLDGDSLPDLYFVSPPDGSGHGRIGRFSPAPTGFVSAGTADLVIAGSSTDSEPGGALVGLPDIDLDGVPELIVGTPESAAGGVWFLPGDLSGTVLLESAANHSFSGGSAGDALGASLLAADLDGDGLDDLVVGAPGLDGPVGDEGGLYVYYAASAPWSYTLGAAEARIDGTVAAGRIGDVPPVAADFDDDGAPDLAVSSAVVGGGVWILAGTQTGAATLDDWMVTRISDAGDSFGAALAAGDLSGDSVAELAVGAPGGGAAYVFAGPLPAGALTEADASATVTGSPALGTTLTLLGDVDGDGVGELAVGDPETATGGAGAVWLLLGGGY